MRLPMVDCRSLIQFCRAFPPRNTNNFTPRRRPDSLNPFSNEFCHRSPLAAVDLVILVLVIVSSAFLILPYMKLFFCELLPAAHAAMVDLILEEPLPYVVGFATVVVGVIVALLIDLRMRKCGNPKCKGLRRAVEYDIQLETEACVKHSPPPLHADAYRQINGLRELELGEDRKELEAELKKMAPVNGRTVLIFRAPCGCPLGRMEVWGHKKVRRIKK
ncbi:uncharacterized protein At5g19025-like [Salvia hispanica]|uniref:uncharacterized protein At5g19025-like n=1 Tax=Salvia hispanica TaxID=49212 RepID=UPI002009D7A6|nr:uncharacterized protein At5g19025-like [Salvia hispanica]